MKCPSAVDGSIAASAPILAFQGLSSDFGNGERFWQVVTRDATPAAGSAAECAPNVRQAWQHIFSLGRTQEGRQELATVFRLCGHDPLKSTDDVVKLALMQLLAWDTMAMGNFPYPSNYLIYQMTGNASTMLPAFPVRAACEHMKDNFSSPVELLDAMRKATGVYYNASGVQCF